MTDIKIIIRSILLVSLLIYKSSNASNQNCEDIIKTGNYTNALITCVKELESKQQDVNSNKKLNLLLKIAKVHHHLGNNNEEKQYLDKIKSHPSFFKNTAIQYEWNRRIGQKFYGQSDFLNAKTPLYEALKIAQDQNNPDWLSKSYNDVGLVESKLENYKGALLHFQQSLELKKTIWERLSNRNNLEQHWCCK